MIITVTESHRNPYFNMVKVNEDGSVGLVIPPTGAVSRRQDAPTVYDIATQFVFEKNRIFDGKIRHVVVPTERAIDIDTMLDFKIAECLLSQK